jgi:hypothetical protein
MLLALNMAMAIAKPFRVTGRKVLFFSKGEERQLNHGFYGINCGQLENCFGWDNGASEILPQNRN